MKKKFLGILSISLPAALVTFMCAEIALRYPCNHGAGFHSYMFHAVWMLILAIVNAVVLKGRKAGIYLSIMCILFIFLSDRLNLYVSYDDWIKRGMPSFGEICK